MKWYVHLVHCQRRSEEELLLIDGAPITVLSYKIKFFYSIPNKSIRETSDGLITCFTFPVPVGRYGVVDIPHLLHRPAQQYYTFQWLKDEVNAALRKKQKVYKDLIQLADHLAVPAMCDEERRYARTIASRHIAHVYKCTEEARNSISKMGKYAEEMIAITRNHMQMAMENATRRIALKEQYGIEIEKTNESACLKDLSKAAVSLGYELDLSLTNARRHNEQSCEKLFVCCTRARKTTDESVAALRDNLYQCVYA
ncbi:unnamed protein product [Parnassius mnemosyne]|uniref:Uncharacterized protein n=1 Tax=Parnassius mnemosyne TaxID=213953 RepID=A0AAV1KNE0_9NEOP